MKPSGVTRKAWALTKRLATFAAQTCNQLAIVAVSAERPQEAERWYLRAIELKEKHSTPSDLASSLNNLANLYLSQNRLDEAEEYARRALAIMETLDLSSEPWKTYNILAQLAEKRGRMDEVREWRRKEQESFAAFAGSDNKIKQWLPIIAAVVAACQGNEEAKNQLEPFLEQQGQTDDWRNLIAVIRRIMNGERDNNLFEGLDGTDALIVTRILQALNGESSPLRPSDTSPKSSADLEEDKSEGGVTLPQLLELVERAAGGDKELGGQLAPSIEKMATDTSLPAEFRAFGRALRDILYGSKSPNLDGVPDELASAIRGMLGRLKNK
ncbi:MAG TPA: tetratricopeptide repeat protein [Anaerolineales bacterium]|nr:tetratricopeptide repeat protein [Anaerolineales bacterium]